ncbi:MULTISPECIES: hypothetical protein [unclassified Microcoleus]|uniref:hypothetical protein n=1 Tax=unclassified Microcoleus TaxID=2642155 RepID=UPI001DD0FFC1|nr:MULTISPECIES: hypothetical protein [unclassified Microcoleus]MCC3421516.1 hypothetical protein [Microcoleus sp. PH2017_07_MST_O_A]MCC3503686.1 hypothetical protein [Microcoleus sp. PH2017_19_SFW_U_A]MCC3508323.1 hypothetical protein [Microcoleus sp. PH2017_17_BER_D_A]TAE66761.1 MAG: hypothetical protein EAZ86_19180 [Oscillatoriales cyanobacterium]MCC3473964.1 hypothetical protein [Microcoleus sp. PH2017_13_LAR_U_A]
MTKTRDEILGQWENLMGETYYLQCRVGDLVDEFDLVEDRLGWRSMGIASFIQSESKFIPGQSKFSPGRLFKKTTLLFPAGFLTTEEIQICLGDRRIGKMLAEFTDVIRSQIRKAASGRTRDEDMLDQPLIRNLREAFEDEHGEHPDAQLIGWHQIEERLNQYIVDIQKEWRKKLKRR